MRFENSNYYPKLKHKKIVLDLGTFYLLDRFIIAEIAEGVHIDWDSVESLIPLIIEYYGENVKIAYISNRIHSYSYDPHVWIKFESDYNFIVASAVTIYYERTKQNAVLDKQFSKNSVKRCVDIDAAIEWVLNLKEFQMVKADQKF